MLEDGHSVLCGLLCMCVSRSGLWFLVVSPACPLSLDASSRPFVELSSLRSDRLRTTQRNAEN
jgi:hypothetical protein